MTQFSREQLVAWAAGFFDGEGCIMITFNKAGCSTMSVGMSQKVEEPLLRIQELWPAFRHYPMGRGKVPEIRMSGKNAGAFLEEVLPYLTVKRTQAELAIELASFSKGSGNSWTVAERERAQVIALAIREAKRPWLKVV